MPGSRARLAFPLISILLLSACAGSSGSPTTKSSSESAAPVGIERAKASLCRHATGALQTVASENAEPVEVYRDLVPALRSDALLYERAGDGRAATLVRNVATAVEKLEAPPGGKVAVYLDDRITRDELGELHSLLSRLPRIRSIEYESKSEAYERAEALFGGDSELIQSVSRDAFPSSFRISLAAAGSGEDLRAELEGRPGVEDVSLIAEFDDLALTLAPLQPLDESCHLGIPTP